MRVTDTTLANQLSGDLESQQATITSLDEELSSCLLYTSRCV